MTQPHPARAAKTEATIQVIQAGMLRGRPPVLDIEGGEFWAAAARAPREAAGTPVPFASRLNEDIALRLRLAALICGIPITRYLDLALDHVLPPVGELAEQIQGGHDGD